MKKVESLKQLKEVIEKTGSLASGKYCHDGSNCVIGHLLLMGGMNQDDLAEIDKGKYDNYSISMIVRTVSNNKEDIVNKTLTSLGFDLNKDRQMLSDLQCSNDGSHGNIVRMLLEIDNLINELEVEN